MNFGDFPKKFDIHFVESCGEDGQRYLISPADVKVMKRFLGLLFIEASKTEKVLSVFCCCC